MHMHKDYNFFNKKNIKNYNHNTYFYIKNTYFISYNTCLFWFLDYIMHFHHIGVTIHLMVILCVII
jgi:hypothetical protein